MTYQLEVQDLEVLARACRALSRARAAEEVASREGPVVLNRFGEARPHPADEVARSNAALFEKFVRALNLEPADLGFRR